MIGALILIALVFLLAGIVGYLMARIDKNYEAEVGPRVDDRFSYEAWHKTCGHLAFTFIDDPRGRTAQSRNVILLDGKHPIPASAITCGFCGATVRGIPASSFDLRPINKIEVN